VKDNYGSCGREVVVVWRVESSLIGAAKVGGRASEEEGAAKNLT
jgi:hypothetical protein